MSNAVSQHLHLLISIQEEHHRVAESQEVSYGLNCACFNAVPIL